mmetsp:Transcript_10621/g.36918  ORF Transcript_10621/g.36918 Transcript_10621/m.36918 type:complete len:254 (-) Transcript_10621:2138-2899(-)
MIFGNDIDVVRRLAGQTHKNAHCIRIRTANSAAARDFCGRGALHRRRVWRRRARCQGDGVELALLVEAHVHHDVRATDTCAGVASRKRWRGDVARLEVDGDGRLHQVRPVIACVIVVLADDPRHILGLGAESRESNSGDAASSGDGRRRVSGGLHATWAQTECELAVSWHAPRAAVCVLAVVHEALRHDHHVAEAWLIEDHLDIHASASQCSGRDLRISGFERGGTYVRGRHVELPGKELRVRQRGVDQQRDA